MILAALVLAAAAHAGELQNDGCLCDGAAPDVAFQVGFADGECWASVFEPQASDYPFTPATVSVLIGPDGTGTFDVGLYAVDGENKPTTRLAGGEFEIAGALTLSTLDLARGGVTIDPVESGHLAVVMCLAGHSGAPAIARDMDGSIQADRNWIRTSDGWQTSQSLEILGDWIMRLGWTDSSPDTDETSDTDPVSDTLTLEAIFPASATVGVPVDVLLRGGGFVPGAAVHIGGLALTGATVESGDDLTGRSPSALPAGIHDVDVVNPDGSSAVLVGAFTVVPADTGCGCNGVGLPAAWGWGAAVVWGVSLRRRRIARR